VIKLEGEKKHGKKVSVYLTY